MTIEIRGLEHRWQHETKALDSLSFDMFAPDAEGLRVKSRGSDSRPSLHVCTNWFYTMAERARSRGDENGKLPGSDGRLRLRKGFENG